MARTLFRLTDRIVKSLTKPGYHADGGGLYLQISRAGTKSWIFRFTMVGRTRDMGLGSIAYVTLPEARARAAEARLEVCKGIDPIESAKPQLKPMAQVIQPKPRGPTFKEFAQQYVESRAGSWRSEKHAAQWFVTLQTYAYPVIGNLALDAIDTPHILQILEPMWNTKSETASRLRGRIERILAAAAVRGLRPATNPAAWAGHLREALPPKRKSVPFAAIPYRQMPTFMNELRARDGIGARALEFLILTASRSTQARGARWGELDVASSVWSAPASRMKAGRPHLVPVSARVLELLEGMRPLGDLPGNFIFPGLKTGTPLSDMTLTKLLHEMGYSETVHGFRAAFKTWAEQETHHANVVIEAALAHTVGDKAERVYMRGDWLEKRRALMDEWSRYCTLDPKATVVPFRKQTPAA